MSEELDYNAQEERGNRPGFLTALCVLSFVWIGFGLLAGLANLATGPSSDEEIREMNVELTKSMSELKSSGMDGFSDMIAKIQRMTEEVNDHFYLAGILNLFVLVVGLFGVIRMLKGYKIGFHLYIGYCLLTIVSVYAYVSPANIPTFVIVFNLIMSALFVFLYSRNLKWMM